MRDFRVYLSALRGDGSPLVEARSVSTAKDTNPLTHLAALFNVIVRKRKDILEGLHS